MSVPLWVHEKFTMLWIDQKVQPSPFMHWLYHWLVMNTLPAPVSRNAQNKDGNRIEMENQQSICIVKASY